jgi:hypothetical protein
LLAIGLAVTAKRTGAAHGADRALLEGYAAFALPLLSYALVGAALGGRSMGGSIAPVVAFGAAPARAATATLVVSCAACAVAASLLAAAVAAIAHGTGDPPLLRDAATSAYAGGLGGLAYAGWLSLGASFGRKGGGRVALLLVDFLATGDDGAFAMLTPRAHVRSLLGGAEVMDLTGRASGCLLVTIAIGCAAAVVARASRS